MGANDVTLEVNGSRTTWQLPEGGWAKIDLASVGSAVSVLFYGESAEGHVITGSTLAGGEQ